MMKNIPIIRFSLITMLFSVMGLQGKSCTGPIQIVCPTIDCNINVVHISQANVGPTGFVITVPGRYCLIEDITFTPTASGTPAAPVAAITILTNNVQLDLNGYVLAGGGTSTNTVGIKVGSPGGLPLTNIQILGGGSGSVQNFTVGILFDPVNNVLIQDLSAINNGANGSITTAGLSFVGGIAVVGAPGTPPTFSQNVVIRRVNTSFNGGTAVFEATVGTLLAFVQSALVENSQFTNNTSSSNATDGLFLLNSNDVDVRDCQANDNSGVTSVTGFRITDSGADGRIQLLRNTANHNFLVGTPTTLVAGQNPIVFADGFYLQTTEQCTLIDCVAIDTLALNGGAFNHDASGFELDQSSDCRLERCIAGDSTSEQFAFGFHIAGNRVTCFDCYAETYVGSTSSVGYELANFTNFGGNPPLGTGIPSFDAIIASKAYAAFNTLDNSIGIHLSGANNCVIDGNLVSANAPDGIELTQVAGVCTSTENVIKHNQILNVAPALIAAGVPAVRGVWAIEDLTESVGVGSRNTFYDNYGFDYPGDGIQPFTNFNNVMRTAGNAIANPTNGFIGKWTIPGDPPTATGITKLTNLDIVYSPCVTNG